MTPVSKTFPGDRVCPAGSFLVQDAFQSVTEGVGNGTYSATYLIGGKSVTVTIAVKADNSFDFAVVGGVMQQLFVKGGQDSGYLLYQYAPPVAGATNNGPVAYDTGLHDGAQATEPPPLVYQDVSHLDFCLIPVAPLTAEKTATGTYKQDISWELTKSVDPASHSGFAGDTFASTWTVKATKTIGAPYGYEVTGSITVYNANPFPVPFSVSDQLDDGTVAAVSCLAYVVPAKSGDVDGSVLCTYSASPLGGTATKNVATITPVPGTGVGGATAEKAFTYSAVLVGYGSGLLTDPRFSFTETISDSFTKTFEETFSCSADAAMYADGKYSYTETNWAYLDSNIGKSASADVTVTCYRPLASKTASASYDEIHTWEIAKSVKPASQSGFAGDELPWTWTVTVSETSKDANFAVTGSIEFKNPADLPLSVTSVSDVLNDGTMATVECGVSFPYVLVAGGTLECTYTASPSGKTATSNTATIVTGKGTYTAEQAVSFTKTVIGGTATVTDNQIGLNESLTAGGGPWTFTGPDGHTCSVLADAYDASGTYSGSEENLAKLVDSAGNEMTASASTAYTCYRPLASKTASASYDEIHTWKIEKSVNPLSQSGFAGDELPWTWTVTVSETAKDANFKVTGSIEFKNPADLPLSVTSVSDQLNDGTVATVDCGVTFPYELAAGETLTCSYTASPSGKTATLNTATIVTNKGTYTAEQTVSFTKTVIGGTATVYDYPLEKLLYAGKGPWTFTRDESHTCSTDRSVYGEDWKYSGSDVNYAKVVDSAGNTKTAMAETTYTCTTGFVDIIKTTNGKVDPSKDIRFDLYLDTAKLEQVSTLGDTDGQLPFDVALVPGTKYTVCEAPVPAGFTFEITFNGGYVTTYAGPPGMPYPTGEIQCFDFVAKDQATLVFEVNNSYPGGAPRTPGYWKNWNTCTSGNQAATAAALGGTDEGVYLLDDLLPQTVGKLTIDTCKVGVYVLNTQWAIGKSAGKSASSDAAYELARNYLAASLNKGAGACVVPSSMLFDRDGKPGGEQITFTQVMADAQALLYRVGYDGDGDLLGPKNKSPDRAYALYLAGILDAYNNSMYCSGTPSH